MGRIDEEMFENATQSANLKTNKKEQTEETQRESSVYDVPKAWLAVIKSNKMGMRSFWFCCKVILPINPLINQRFSLLVALMPPYQLL